MADAAAPSAMVALRGWTARQWTVSLAGAVAVLFVVGIPTALIDTPLFSRSIAAPVWAAPAWVASAALSGLLMGSYVDQKPAPIDRRGGIGALLGFLAVGCPVCNKLVLLALGTNGAVSIFQPLQPLLAVASLLLLGWALRSRLRSTGVCPVPSGLG